MTNEKKRYKVTICCQEYTLISSEHEEYILEAARLVDSTMQEIAGKSSVTDQQKVAVLAALHMATSVVQARVVTEQQIRRYQELVASIDKLCV